MTVKLRREYPHAEDVDGKDSRNFSVARDSCFYFGLRCGLETDSFPEFQTVRWYCDYHINVGVAFALEAGFIVGRQIQRDGYEKAKKYLEGFLKYDAVEWE